MEEFLYARLHKTFEVLSPVTKEQYRARCHCGRIRFSFESEPIKTGVRCDCSMCIRRGAVMSSVYFPASDFRPHSNKEDFYIYRWNDRVVDFLTCKTCGIYPYHGDSEYGYRVNLGCVEGLDALQLEIKILDGKGMPLADLPGPHPGEKF